MVARTPGTDDAPPLRVVRASLLAALTGALATGCASRPAFPPAGPATPPPPPALLVEDAPPEVFTAPGTRRFRLPDDDRREFWITNPGQAADGKALPVVISLHGNGGSGAAEARRWPLVSASERVLVVCPDTLGAYTGDPADYARDERAVLAILARVLERWPVDGRRVLLTGFSGGALSAQWTAARHPQLFAGLALRSPSFPHALLRDPGSAARMFATGLPIWICRGEHDHPETVEDVKTALEHYAGAGYGDDLLRLEVVAGSGHDGSAGVTRLAEWMRGLPDNAKVDAEKPPAGTPAPR